MKTSSVRYTECTWTFTAPQGQQVKITFTDMEIERHSRCSWDHLEVIDGSMFGALNLVISLPAFLVLNVSRANS